MSKIHECLSYSLGGGRSNAAQSPSTPQRNSSSPLSKRKLAGDASDLSPTRERKRIMNTGNDTKSL